MLSKGSTAQKQASPLTQYDTSDTILASFLHSSDKACEVPVESPAFQSGGRCALSACDHLSVYINTLYDHRGYILGQFE